MPAGTRFGAVTGISRLEPVSLVCAKTRNSVVRGAAAPTGRLAYGEKRDCCEPAGETRFRPGAATAVQIASMGAYVALRGTRSRW